MPFIIFSNVRFPGDWRNFAYLYYSYTYARTEFDMFNYDFPDINLNIFD